LKPMKQGDIGKQRALPKETQVAHKSLHIKLLQSQGRVGAGFVQQHFKQT
jgi:hypothetical protein